MSAPGFSENRDNFCYRHPDRQSFVLCQRCLRTICPQCQTQAPVGVICPECLAAQRNAQTPAQHRARQMWRRSARAADGRPIVTYVIIGLTALVGLLQMIPGGIGAMVTDTLLYFPPWLYPQLSGVFEPWRLLSALFVHGSFWHFALNMLALYFIGRVLEPTLGRGRFIALYLISGLGGSVAVALLAPLSAVVGASGAVFGLLGALLVIGRHLGANITGILVILGLNLVIGFLPGMNVSWQAHVGGAAIGALVGFIFARTRKPQQRLVQILLLAGVVAALLALVAFVPPALILAQLGR